VGERSLLPFTDEGEREREDKMTGWLHVNGGGNGHN
jgi:hypothetical protein